MALIICEKCGKKISDTVPKCIHCGAVVKKETNDRTCSQKEEVKKPLEKNVAKVQLKAQYFSLDSSTQNKLEKEFLAQDKKAMKFKRKEIEFKKFSALGNFALYASAFCILGIRVLLTKVLGVTEFFNAEYAGIGAAGLFVTLGLGILISIFSFVGKTIFNRSTKKYIYMKKFQRWLKRDKDIDYDPIFVTNSEKSIFDQIDLNTMDL